MKPKARKLDSQENFPFQFSKYPWLFMFSFLSNLARIGQRGHIKSDKEFVAAAQRHDPSPLESTPTAPASGRAEFLKQRASQALVVMGDRYDTAIKDLSAAGHISGQDAKLLRTQLETGVGLANRALSEATFLKQSADLARLQFDRPGPAGIASKSGADKLAMQEQAAMKSATRAVTALQGIAETWQNIRQSLPEEAQSQFGSVLDDAHWHLRSLGQNVVATALTHTLPQSAQQVSNDSHGLGGASGDEIRAIVFDSAQQMSPQLQASVGQMTTALSHLLADPTLACAPANEDGIQAGVYPLPTGAPISRPSTEEWAETAISTFASDLERDTISGGALTIDGRNAVSSGTLTECQALRVAMHAATDESAKSASSMQYLARANDASHEAVEAIRAAVPEQLFATVIGVATQRSLLELNAQFATNSLGAISAGFDSNRSKPADFAIRTQASHGRPGVVEVQASKTCVIKGFATANGQAVPFNSPQQVTLSGTFEVSESGVRIKAASAEVHPFT